jgi:hypothetical protein
MDLGRLAAAVQRPGIDPRTWVSMALALDESVMDQDHGDFVDVQLLPHMEPMTASISPGYAGPAFGDHDGTIHKHDLLVVILPSGDPNEGCHVVAKVWSAANVPPQLALANPADLVRVAETDVWIRTLLQGKGQWHLETDPTNGVATVKAPAINLGDDTLTESLILGTTYRQKQALLHTQLQGQLTALAALIATAGANLTTAGPLTLLPPAGVAISAAGAALTSSVASITGMQASIQAFEAAGAAVTDYQSQVSKTK